MGASRATWAFLGLMATIASGSSPYSDQPRLESRDGHLLIVGASGANISLQTSQGGQININDEDIIHVLNMARQAAQKVDKWGTTGTGGDSSGNPGLNVFLEPLEKRLTLVEKKMSLSTVDLLTPRRSSALDTIKARQGVRQRFRQLNITVTRLEKNLRSLRTLLETNECASGPCLHGGTCQDMFNSFHCICPDQWEGNICEKDVDECEEFRNTGLGCQNGATCQNLPGSYSCICPPEWYGMHCTKKNRDCKTSGRASLCGNGDCFDTSTGVLCQCYQGWTTDKVTGACTVDIDECAGLTNPCSHDPLVQCENLPGSFKCGPCPIGYAGNGYQCRDIDECFTNNGGCSNNPKVQCVNTRGSRFCGPCPPGYSGDGVSCSRVDDLCQVNRGGCHPLAQCIHNSGLTYVQCRCPVGWVGSGVGENGCTQDNTTATDICPLFYCLNGGTCSISSDRNFRCSCPPGFTGPRCEIGDIVCASQPCQNNGTCIAIPGQVSYKCACLFGYTGDNCEYTSVGCGGNIVASEGTFSFPNTSLESHRLPLTCRWNIRLPNDSLVFNFTVNYNISCYMDFLTIHEGTNFQYPTEKFCGFGLSKNHTTTREFIKVIYEYVSSSKSLWINQIGKFKLSWTSVPKKCGGFIAAKSHGQISSPGFPGYYPNLSRCKWTLSAPPGKRILLTFSDMDIVPHNDSDDALKIFDGPEITETPLATFKQKTIPAPITTSSNEATLLFETDDFGSERGFQIVYSLVEGIPGCGGLLTAPFGRITPPQGHKSDGDLAEQLTCEWKIRMSGRDTIKVETKNFKLEYSDGCKYDSLEFYDGPDTESRLIGRWCGESGPELLKSSGNSMTIVLITDQTYNEGSFTIDYSTVCDIELSTPNGILASPLYPNHYPADRVCHYLIALPVGYAISLQLLDLDLEHKATMIDDNGNDVESCLYDSLSIYDGDSPNSKLLTELCGNGTISNIISSHNYMLLVFKTDVSGGGRGFKANYTSIENKCGGIFRSDHGTINSPAEIPSFQKCKWIISAPAGKVIELGWSSLIMPVSTFCTNGYIEIFENSTDTSKAHKLGETYCGGKQPPAMTSSSNVLMIVLTTPTYSNFMARFIAYYRIRNVDEGCSANFFSLNGAIQSPQYPKNYPNGHNCVWTITVPAGKQISLHFTDFELEGEAPCKSDFLEIRNGGGANSPLIGKYCGAIIGDEITSFGNQLYIRFFSDSAISFKGFSLTWDGTLSGCGGDLNGYSGSIISPNYPYPYARRGRCTWRISVSQGSVVALSIVDIDLETSPTCSLDFIEIRDGSTSRSPLLGKYCASDHPITIASTSNAMRIYFQSDISKEGRGFHLKFSTVCNRTIKGYRGVIESPEFPMALTQPLDCTWTIEAPMGNAFTVVFSHLMFVKDKLLASICPSSSPICEGYTNCNSNALQISEGPSTNGKMLGTYCGSQSLMPTINSTFNQVHVHLKVTGFRSEVLFRLEWFVFGCGGILKGKSYGELSTPDYPDLISRPLVCEWTIIADLGNSIKFSVVDLAIDKPNDCDQNFLEFFGGPDSTSPLRNKFCHSSTDGSSVDVQTSGNRAFVRLQVNQALKHFRFKANYEEIHSSCGGFFSVQEGSFHSKNYPQNYDSFDDCAYTIMIAENHRINLTFVDFDLYNRFTSNCSYSYVKVYDGQINDNSTLIRTLCGSKIPQSIISTSNVLNIRFNAGERVAKGFLAKYAPICGTNINVTDDGVLSHTEYYTTRSYHNCTWVLRTDKLGKKLTLTFTHLEIRRSAASKSSVGNNQGLTIYAGLDESILLLNLTDDVSPPALVVPGGVATVKLVTSPDLHVSFNLHYSTYDNVCGGTFEADRGQFASPNYPDNYPPNVECVWDIINTPGNTLVLQFEELKIQSSDSCNDNYVEVRAKDQSGTLIGTYCGQMNRLPLSSVVDRNYWIKFKSSTNVDKGFKASFYIAPFTVTGKPEGDLQSPRYPMASIRKSDYKWRITTTSSSRIDISFNEIYFEGSTTCVDKLTLFDGYDETGKILKEFCGLGDTTDLEKVQTTSNAVFIVFHSPAYPARFSISWKQVHRTPKIAGVNSSVNCTHRLQIPADSEVDFTSPGFPHGYARNLRCEWILVTDPQNHVRISFSTIDIERYRGCISDKIEVFDALSDGSWKQLAKLCNANDTDESISGSSMMKVTFSTDFYGNKTGFSASASSDCGGRLTEPDGVIVLNRTTVLTESCVWNITVKPGKRIEVTFASFKFPEPHDSTACSKNHLLLREGFEDDAPFVGSGKFCDSIPAKKFITSSNRLSIVASGKDQFSFMIQQMELRYITKSRTCTSNVHLNPKSLRSMIIRSPNYPNMPPPHSECTWQFFAPNSETIHIEFLDRFDLSSSYDCENEYLELRDGSTELSPLLGKFCYSTPPPFVMTEGNALFIKYFTDVQYPNNGFKAKVSLSDCGGTFHDFYSGSIETPNYPSRYDPKVNCVWRFINKDVDKFKITVNKFRLTGISYRGMRACNTTTMDTLTITSVNKVNPDLSESWIVCGTNFTAPLEIPGNELLLNFTANNVLPNMFRKLGFQLALSARKNPCGGDINSPSGEIKSPGYPSILTATFCSWKITVPEGRRVTLNLTEFNFVVPSVQVYGGPIFKIYNDLNYQSPLASWNSSLPAGTTISSSDNEMMIYFYSHQFSNTRFRGFYTSDLPSLCLTEGLDQPSGTINVNFLQPYSCEWNVISKENNSSTTSFVIVGIVNGDKATADACYAANSRVQFLLGERELIETCKASDPSSPFIVVSPYSSNTITAMSSDKSSSNYTISWVTRTCGGHSSQEGSTIISSPTEGGLYPSNYDCVWQIDYPEETTIRIQFNSLDLDMTGSTVNDCSSDYLAIHNGGSPSSPMISKSCGTILPPDLVTLSNSLWIHFHSDGSNQAKGFKITLSPAQEACGGIIHGNTGTLMSVNYPNQYPNQTNCIFEIQVDKGYHIGLQFVERFYIEDSPGCVKDYVEVLNFNESSESWEPLGKVCGRENPRIFNSTSNKMRVRFKSDEFIQGDGFKASWNTNCGGVYDGSKPGIIHSPHYPHNYDSDLSCNYTITVTNPSQLIYGSFKAFELEPRNDRGCLYDFVDIFYYQRRVPSTFKFPLTLLGRYCGTQMPPRFVTFGTMKLSFVTDRFTEFKGFLFSYGPEVCGGNITQPTIIKNNVSPLMLHSYLVNCTWQIFAPSADQVVVIRIQELSTLAYPRCRLGSVRIWDGDVVQANNSNLMATLCGTLWERSGVYRTTSRNAIINFSSQTSNQKFVAEITFVPSCNNRKDLRESEEFGVDFGKILIKNYSDYVECTWVFTSPESTTLSATISKTSDGCPRGNQTASVEFYDGFDENADLIGRFNCSTIPERISSSRSVMTVKYSTNLTSQASGFTATMKAVKSPCGLSHLNVTDEPQTLTSPFYPNKYPTNIYCKWFLVPRSSSTYIRIENVDIVQSPGCVNNSLQIKDIGTGIPFASGRRAISFGKKVYIGSDKRKEYEPNLIMGSKYPYATSIFCGVRQGVDYYASSGLVMIKFLSSSKETSKGFKITYSTAGCSRNFTDEQGRIKLSEQNKSCKMHVVSPNPNSTIALYFSELRTFNFDQQDVLKIYDGMDTSQESKLLVQIKRNLLVPAPVFSHSSSLTISITIGSRTGPVSLDLTYTTTTEGRGCGGNIFNYGGVFTSPLYPRNVRNFTTCRWDVAVPYGGAIELEFTTFDLGPKYTCQTDYLQIYDVDPATSTEVLRRTYCGGDIPAKYRGEKGRIAVRYVTSIHNGGTGFVARFMSRNTDPSWPALIGEHLIS